MRIDVAVSVPAVSIHIATDVGVRPIDMNGASRGVNGHRQPAGGGGVGVETGWMVRRLFWQTAMRYMY